MLIFARHVVLTYPDYTPRSELMPNFDGIYLEKKYGVRTGNIAWLLRTWLGKVRHAHTRLSSSVTRYTPFQSQICVGSSNAMRPAGVLGFCLLKVARGYSPLAHADCGRRRASLFDYNFVPRQFVFAATDLPANMSLAFM